MFGLLLIVVAIVLVTSLYLPENHDEAEYARRHPQDRPAHTRRPY